jgi:hypothetical protein
MRRQTMIMMALLVACGNARDAKEHAHTDDEGWAVTSWGDTYEIFAECEPLIAGQVARSHTHVTVLSDFSPLRSGNVSAVLRSKDGGESVFAQDKPTRDGIFSVAIAPSSAGDYDLVFRVESAAGNEDVASGRVRVGSAEIPGGVLDEHTSHEHGSDHAHEHDHAHGEPVSESHAAETVSFLKEQQWRTEFRTEWATEGEIAASVRAPATVRAAAGAEVLLTAVVIERHTGRARGRDRDCAIARKPVGRVAEVGCRQSGGGRSGACAPRGARAAARRREGLHKGRSFRSRAVRWTCRRGTCHAGHSGECRRSAGALGSHTAGLD